VTEVVLPGLNAAATRPCFIGGEEDIDAASRKPTPQAQGRAIRRGVSLFQANWASPFLLGVGVTLISSAPVSWFWIGAIAFYLGAVLLALDIWREEFFAGLAHKIRVALLSLYAAGVIGFTFFWMWAPAPLAVNAEARNPAYDVGALLGGIQWESRFSEITIRIRNDTSHDYTNVIIRVETALGIEQLRPQELWLDCSSFPDEPPMAAPRVVNHWRDSQGQWHEREGTSSPSADIPAWAYRITCNALPHDTELNLIGATSNQNLEPNQPIGSSLYLPPIAARWIKVAITYDFRHSERIEQTFCFTGKLGRSMSVADCADSLWGPNPFRSTPLRMIEEIQIERQKRADHDMSCAVFVYSSLVLGCPLVLLVLWLLGIAI
jgi:hypothetical protein